MMNDYKKIFDILVSNTKDYLVKNNIEAMILGISGGIDSTVCAAICHEVSKQTGIPLIGRSLPTKYNKEEETAASDLVGRAFCNDYTSVNIHNLYQRVGLYITTAESAMIANPRYPQTKIADGNIQARLRMIYLYNLASIHKGVVIDTDNLTEHNLGYWTIHGDVGDFNPIGGLWKTEIFELAEGLVKSYDFISKLHSNPRLIELEKSKADAIRESLKLKPTAGLGITNSDLEEIGAESYEQVDGILQEILAWKANNADHGIYYESPEVEQLAFLDEQQMLCYPIKVIIAVTERHFKSEFKRKGLPVVISRSLFTS